MTASPQRRPIVWVSVVAVLIIVVAFLFVISLGSGGTSTTPMSSTSTRSTTTEWCAGVSTSQTVMTISGPVLVGATGKVTAGVTCPDGHLGTILSYSFGQPITIYVSVTSSFTPSTIQIVYDGSPRNLLPWDVGATGRTYVLDYGGAGESPLTLGGTHNLFAEVTFSDKTNATSNLVTFTVNAPQK